MNDQAASSLSALLALVDEHRERECRSIREAAQKQAREVIAQAYRGARERLHAAVVAERRRMEARIETERVQLETRERERKMEVTAALLREAWSLLSQRVRARWHDPTQRHAWVTALTDDGLRALPHQRWVVRHAPDWPAGEQAALAQRIRDRIGQSPTFAADPNILAGLRFEADGAALDGTLDGILSDHREIEAQLLAEAEQP